MTPQATYFGSDALPLSGWFHSAQHASAAVGVVLCSAWGREEASSHYSLRQWARQLSAAGWPCLRFDYLGEGDSAGYAITDGGPEAWMASVEQAIEELKRLSGVTQVVLLGIRLGALLGGMVAQGRDDVAAFVAVAPVVKGRGYVRELIALQAAMSKGGVDQPVAGVFQSGGYTMAESAKETLSHLDLTELATAPAKQVLVLDRDDLPASQTWLKNLAGQGVQVEHRALPGYVDMMSDPHRVVAPQAMIDASLTWLSRLRCDEWANLFLPEECVTGPAICTQAFMPVQGGAESCVREQAVDMPGVPARGVLSRPADGQVRSGHAILILNAGSVRHTGLSRMSVDMARLWAAAGHAVLRLDLAGIGDAPGRPGRPDMMSYPYEAMQDVAAGLACLRGLPGVRRVHVHGLCAGAYHAFKAACEGLQLDAIVMINPLVYFNAEGLTPQDDLLTPQRVYSASESYKASAVSREKWLKLLKGQVQFRAMTGILLRRLQMSLHNRLRNLARTMHWPMRDDLGSTLRDLCARGLLLDFVFAQGDPGELMLYEQAGSMLQRLLKGRRLQLRAFPGADHVFTDVALRRKMLAHLDDVLSRHVTLLDSAS